MTRLPDNSFQYCSTLTEVVLPKNVKAIGQDCFSHTPNLRYINLPYITSFGRQCFGMGAQIDNVNLKEAHFRNLTSAGYLAYQNRYAFKLFECGSGTTTLCMNPSGNAYNSPFVAIVGTSNSAPFKLVCHAKIPPSLGLDGTMSGKNSFNSISHYYIYVPDDSIAAYQGDTTWANFSTHILPLSDYPNKDELLYMEG